MSLWRNTSCAGYTPAVDQQVLVDYTRAGGQLVVFPQLPDREMSQEPCRILRDAIAVDPCGTEHIDSPLIDVYHLQDIKCANPQIVYDESSLGGAEVIARTISGAACGFKKTLGRGAIIHLGTWIGFDTEAHRSAYEAILMKSGARLRHASASNDQLVVSERFTDAGAAMLFIGNYHNQEQEGHVTYTHPESGEPIRIPYGQAEIHWPALYGVLTPVCLELSAGVRLLHTTSDILNVIKRNGHLTITIHGDRDLPGEMILEGSQVDKIQSAAMSGGTVTITMVRDARRAMLRYAHRHNVELSLEIRLQT